MGWPDGSEYGKLYDKFKRDTFELQMNCKHSNVSEWCLSSLDGIHGFYEAIYCDRCHKQMATRPTQKPITEYMEQNKT